MNSGKFNKYIAVLLTVHNRRDKTLSCLYQLFRQDIPANYTFDVYLTDDGCTDGTPEAVREQYPQVNIVQGDGNLYWNRGMYTAWEAASKSKDYDYYLWLNDDTLLFDNAITGLIKCSSEYLDKAIIVGPTVDTSTHKQITYGGRVKGNKVPVPSGESIEVDYFNGNIVMVPKSVFKILGNLDYYFVHSKGDFDYGMRARQHGIKIYQAGTAIGECDAHESVDKCYNPRFSLAERWKSLNGPLGQSPRETFYLERRHYGLLVAAFHYFTVQLRCIFPQLWKLKEL